jgi:4-hydroxybenzoate polyprenyltransferase
MKKIWAYIALARPLNLFFVVLAQVLCAYYILHLKLDLKLAVLFISTVMITAAGYIINDYFDVKADAVNKPKKVFVGRTVRRRDALFFVFILNFGTLLTAWLCGLGKTYLVVFSLTIVSLWFYSYLLKRSFLAGNLLVAFLASYSIYILSYMGEKNNLLLSFVFFAFFSNLIREIIKDCEDIKGDLLLNSRTIPIIIGIPFTKVIISILNTIFITSVMVAYYKYQETKMLASIFIIVGLCAYIYYLMIDKKSENFKTASQIMKVIMLVGCLSIPLV